jgi:hypothetical protein
MCLLYYNIITYRMVRVMTKSQNRDDLTIVEMIISKDCIIVYFEIRFIYFKINISIFDDL